MRTFKEFGYLWEERTAEYEPGKTYAADTVTKYSEPINSKNLPVGVSTRRLGISAEKATTNASGIQIAKSLGFGSYEVILKGRLDGLDPSIAVAVFLHNDDLSVKKRIEVDFEASLWNDPNHPDGFSAGFFVNSARPPQSPKPLLSRSRGFLYHKITLFQSPVACSVVYEGWRESDQRWINSSSGNWANIDSTDIGLLRISVWRFAEQMYPPALSQPAKVAIAGFKFTPILYNPITEGTK